MISMISKVFDKIAGWCMVATMALIVGNILLRSLIKQPILGTYEYVGFLTALIIGLSLAYCAVQNGHIAVTFIAEKFSPGVQYVITVIIDIISFIFLSLATWHTGKYAYSMILSGEVSPTTKMPFYPFIYLVTLGLFMLSLVILFKLIEYIRKGVKT
ncbi:MAG TPA: TRAP transporter small permease [Firmicutes bacterium]|nr:TRAP transporter small permease [Bacillota bacterium]